MCGVSEVVTVASLMYGASLFSPINNSSHIISGKTLTKSRSSTIPNPDVRHGIVLFSHLSHPTIKIFLNSEFSIEHPYMLPQRHPLFSKQLFSYQISSKSTYYPTQIFVWLGNGQSRRTRILRRIFQWHYYIEYISILHDRHIERQTNVVIKTIS